jgi:hypothetical protein
VHDAPDPVQSRHQCEIGEEMVGDDDPRQDLFPLAKHAELDEDLNEELA